MEFKLSKSQNEIQKAAWDFARGEFDKNLALDLDKNSQFPEAIRKKACDLGFIGIHFDEKYSGGGLGVIENALLAETFCRKDSGIGIALMLSGYASECLLRFGKNELGKIFLPKIAEGEMISAGAFHESDKGFDLSAIETHAVKEKDEWVITGSKAYVINGRNAGFYIVLCRTDPAGSSDADLDLSITEGISMVLVESDRDGIFFETMGEKLGSRMIETARLTFDQVRVPKTNIVGKEGNGLAQIRAFFNESRLLTAAMSLGIAQGAFDRAIGYVKQREQFGKKIAGFEVTRHKLADMAIKIELARLITYQAAWQCDHKKADEKLSCMAKLYASQAAVEVSDEAMQLLGGYGYMAEYEVERFYRDAKIIELFEDQKNTQKNLVADALTGKSGKIGK
ncbi:acyl-CoA dehydrogenase family protein [Desulfobacterales bacterium HSG16]|nr:acyl-CoA dehydrogenase family protein [Desulfobacterales bacterium HSG16]